MIFVDASVWIDYLRDRKTPQTVRLGDLFSERLIAVGDLTLTEVLQGISGLRAYAAAERLLMTMPVVEIVGKEVAVQAAQHYRLLRTRGITVRGTIDTLIATRCIKDEHALLFSDRDFDPFVAYLGLVSAMAD